MFSIKQLLSIDKIYDSWSIPRIIRHVLYWSFWVLFYSLVNTSMTTDSELCTFTYWFLLEALLLLAKVPLAYFVAYYLIPKYIPKKEYLKTVLFILLAAFVALQIIILINHFYIWQPKGFSIGKTAQYFFSTKGIHRYIDLIYTCMPLILVKMTQSQIQQNKIHHQLFTEKTNAELQNLKNQLQPHFLFNTLNNIYGMILSQEKKASDAVLKLSEILSYMLYDCKNELVDLRMELKMLQNYMELEKMRYGNKLDLSYNIDGDTNGILIAPLLFMPFVENAFKHGVSNTEKVSWVSVNVQLKGQNFSFTVENSFEENKNAQRNMKSGIGLENVNQRLQLLYPNKHELTIKSDEFFFVKLNLSL